jgi:hypothetical protein
MKGFALKRIILYFYRNCIKNLMQNLLQKHLDFGG